MNRGKNKRGMKRRRSATRLHRVYFEELERQAEIIEEYTINWERIKKELLTI